MKKQKQFVKHSIKFRIALSFMLVVFFTIFLCWILNNAFLQTYYEMSRQEDLMDGYNQLCAAVEAERLSDEDFQIEMMELSHRSNISGIVLDSASITTYHFGSDQLALSQRVRDYVFGGQIPVDKVVIQTDEYTILRTIDRGVGGEYLEMHGVIGTGTVFLMRVPLANVRESVELANRFLLYVGIGAAVLSGIIIWMITGTFTEPILELVEISRRMKALDFDAKYTGKGHTEVSLLGENINSLSETLERTISELKTANNELQQDIEKKNEVDEMRKEFLSNVSHELKTPIALIQGYAEGLKEGINDDLESRQFYCDVIIDEAAKMNDMVKKLLTLNQLEFGSDNVAMERFDIVDLICNYLQSAQILTRQNEVSVRMKHYEPIFVWADEYKVEEVFTNYFTNALNHVSGDKIVDVRLVKTDKVVRISVFNTGDPIPEESISHLWEKFYKVDKARTREYGGSGVGLSIVKAIMESMNQKFGVINYDNGVEFWFELEIASGNV